MNRKPIGRILMILLGLLVCTGLVPIKKSLAQSNTSPLYASGQNQTNYQVWVTIGGEAGSIYPSSNRTFFGRVPNIDNRLGAVLVTATYLNCKTQKYITYAPEYYPEGAYGAEFKIVRVSPGIIRIDDTY